MADFTLRVSKCYFVHGSRVYLIRRADNGAWEPPGGTWKRGEDARAAAEREAREEIGIDGRASSVLVQPAVRHPTKKGLWVREHHVILTPRVAGQPLALDPAEVAEGRWCTREEALALEPRGNMDEDALDWALAQGGVS